MGIKDAHNISVDLDTCQTNIVKVNLLGNLKGKAWLKALEEEACIRGHYITDDAIRLVTYRGITDEDIDEAIARIVAFCANH
jgi:threonine aldolase